MYSRKAEPALFVCRERLQFFNILCLKLALMALTSSPFSISPHTGYTPLMQEHIPQAIEAYYRAMDLAARRGQRKETAQRRHFHHLIETYGRTRGLYISEEEDHLSTHTGRKVYPDVTVKIPPAWLSAISRTRITRTIWKKRLPSRSMQATRPAISSSKTPKSCSFTSRAGKTRGLRSG